MCYWGWVAVGLVLWLAMMGYIFYACWDDHKRGVIGFGNE